MSLLLLLAALVGAVPQGDVPVAATARDKDVSSKLDPQMLATLEGVAGHPDSEAQRVDVMIGLGGSLDDETRADLQARGLQLRSEIGDVLTGAVAIGDVARLAESPAVIKIEASTPMRPESGAQFGAQFDPGELPVE